MQIRSILSGGCCLALLAAAGIAHAATLSNRDKQFMEMAAKTDMTEAHEGQMAQDQAERADVKDFGKTLVQDHTDSYQQLTELANKTGASIPKGIDVSKEASIKQITKLKGSAFDRQFIKGEIAGHRKAIAAYKHEAEHGEDPDVKAYANKMVPVLEKHLHLAEDCAKPAKRT